MEDCCADETNMGQWDRLPDAGDGEYFRRCKGCGRRHFTVFLDPMVIGVDGSGRA